MKEDIKNLPVYPYLEDICFKLKNSKSRFLILNAETGAGKSTALPVALLQNFEGKILMLEPRRMAAINVAERVSWLLDEQIGGTCGYSIHLDKKVSQKTRFEVLTENLLIKRIQKNPLLEDINVVVLDEFHERSVNLDLALAFLQEAVSLRDDLFVVIMSATINSNELVEYLSKTQSVLPEEIPVVKVKGRTFPVTVKYCEKTVKDVVLESVDSELLKDGGSVLVFLPGIKDILENQRLFEESNNDPSVKSYVLHSSIAINEQKVLLNPAQKNFKRVIFSSSIAETSVTIPDVKIVVDSGYGKYNFYDKKQQMNKLIVQRISEYSAEQRKGRAGRLSEGLCIRLWNQNEKLVESLRPEIERIDLSNVVLECYDWGICDFKKLSWLNAPGESSWNSSTNFLEDMEFIFENKITDLGKAVLSLGIDLRIGAVALSGIGSEENLKLSTELARNILGLNIKDKRTLDLQMQDLKQRVQNFSKNSQLKHNFALKFTEFSTGNALLCGYPDRIARKVVDNLFKTSEIRYEFPSGRLGILIKHEESVPYPEYLVAVSSDAGDQIVKIYDYYVINREIAEKFLEKKAKTSISVKFKDLNSLKIEKKEVVSYKKLVLKEKALKVEKDDYKIALCNAVKESGIQILPISVKSKNLMLRYEFYINHSDEENKLIKMNENPEEWLVPFLTENNVSEKNVDQALNWYLNESLLNESVPVEIKLENNKRLKIKYEKEGNKIIPAAEIIIQQLFGCFTNPKVMNEPVLLRLLSPARRPLQVTRDLDNFWENSWKEICSEMKGRYPKHNWNYRIAEE